MSSRLAVFTMKSEQDCERGIRERESAVEIESPPKALVGAGIQGKEPVNTLYVLLSRGCRERREAQSVRIPLASRFQRFSISPESPVAGEV